MHIWVPENHVSKRIVEESSDDEQRNEDKIYIKCRIDFYKYLKCVDMEVKVNSLYFVFSDRIRLRGNETGIFQLK